ncbi:MAG: WecB/TagA/CpsF family glycosyltransferase [Paracoccaceae bacterium]
MSVRFTDRTLGEWIAFLKERARQEPFGYLATPNVDHLVNYLGQTFDTAAYSAAELMMNDSRILGLLARACGKSLRTTPGADLVRAVLRDEGCATLRIAIVGPAREDFDRLAEQLPGAALEFVAAPPDLVRGSPEWVGLLDRLARSDFDLLLSCLSFPKQEYLVHDLRAHGRTRGFAICAGASVDYLTGKQKRAPGFLQKLTLEWAFRLLADPRRMWRRYLVTGPRIFIMFLQYELLGRRTADMVRQAPETIAPGQ